MVQRGFFEDLVADFDFFVLRKVFGNFVPESKEKVEENLKDVSISLISQLSSVFYLIFVVIQCYPISFVNCWFLMLFCDINSMELIKIIWKVKLFKLITETKNENAQKKFIKWNQHKLIL